MIDLERELSRYGEYLTDTVSAVGPDEIEVFVADAAPTRRSVRPVLVAAFAAVTVLALIGGTMLILREGQQQQPVVTAPPQPQPTAVLPPEPTVVPDLESESDPTVPRQRQPGAEFKLPPSDDFPRPDVDMEAVTILTVPAELVPQRPPAEAGSFDVATLVWERVDIPDDLFAEGEWPSRFAAVGSRLVILGTGKCDGERVAAVWTSEDGYTWSRLPHDDDFHLKPPDSGQCPLGFRDVVAAGPGLVAVGDIANGEPHHALKAAVWTSADGLTWSRSSPDGDNESPTESTRLRSIYRGGPGLVAVGSACEPAPGCHRETVVWTSPDGMTWTRVEYLDRAFASTLVSPDGRSFVEHVAANTSGFIGAVTLERSSLLWVSTDGITWTRTSVGSCAPGVSSRLAASSERFVAIARCNGSTTTWTSTNGQDWTATALGTGMSISDLVAVGDGFIAVGVTFAADPDCCAITDMQPQIWTSIDGLMWLPVTLDHDAAGKGDIDQVFVAGVGLIAIGSSPEGPTIWVATPTTTS